MKLKTIEYLKENEIEFYLCKLCGQIVDRNHFDTQEHIDKFNDVCKIDIKKCFENVFLTIDCKCLDMIYNYIYSDLYFKKHIKKLIFKDINTVKYYKSYIIKKLMLDFNGEKEKQYYSEKFNSNNILKDSENFEKIEKNDDIIQPYLIKNSSKDYSYDLERMYLDIDEVQCIKILMNSFYGSMLTDKTRFRDIKICVNKEQSMKLVKQPTFKSYKTVNDELIIVEMNKDKCIFDSPTMIGSIVLFNSKCNLYNYMYNIIPEVFGKKNITFSMQDTDSIIYKIQNCTYEKYLKILKENSHLFGKEMGLMENELLKKILEIISLRSKCYSILTVDDVSKSKSKCISKNYCKVNHTHEYFRKILFNELKTSKAEYYKISLKDTKLISELQIKDDISNFNDKRYMIDNLTGKPHTINL